MNSEADKVSIIATCMRILKEAAVPHEHAKQAPLAAAADDSGWLEDGDVQESLKELVGADVTVPEQPQ